MRLQLLTVLFLSVLSYTFAQPPADISPEQLRAALPEKLEHPYVYFTESDKPILRERIKNHPIAKRLYSQMKADADAALAGDDSKVNTQNLAFVYQMTDDKRYAQKAFEFIQVAAFSPDEFKELGLSFSLSNSRTCRGLAPLYDWLYTGLDEKQRQRLRDGLRRELSLVAGDKYEATWWTTAYRCNWNPVCNSSVGVAAAALLAEDETMIELMTKAYNGIYKTYNELGIDGGWTEGVNYWSYGVFVSLLYVDSVRNLTDGELNLLEHEKIVANPVTFGLHTIIAPGRHIAKPYDERGRDWKSVNFEDSGNKREDNTYSYNKIAEATGSGEAIWLRDNIFGSDAGSTVFDIIWAKPEIEPAVPQQASKLFRDYGWAIMRSDFDSVGKAVVAAVCSEHWDPTREFYLVRFPGAPLIPSSEKPWGLEFKVDPYAFSHGHLHAGTFNVYWQGESYICDLGVPSYPKNFWQPDGRWKHVFANSFGHNVVHVNGVGQISGKGVGGKILEFETSQSRDYTLMDATGAYPKDAMDMWRRHLVLDKPAVTVVLDEVEAKKGDKIDIRYHSDCDVVVRDRIATIEGESGTMALIPVVPVIEGNWQFVSGAHNFNPDYPNWDKWYRSFEVRIRAYNDITFIAEKDKNLVATVILPVEDAAEAKQIAKSVSLQENQDGTVVLSFEKAGTKSVFNFAAGKDGLRLKKI